MSSPIETQDAQAAPASLQAPGPTISVVINTCDRCEPLRSVLHALRRQTHTDFEVVVVVGPTHDDTFEMLEDEFSGRVHVARCAEFNLSVSRNVGIRQVLGEVVAFIDDDSVPAPTWLTQLADAYRAHPQVAGVGGRTYLVAPEESDSGVQFLSGLVSALAEQDDVRWDESAPPEVIPASVTPREFWFPRFHGTNMSYRRSALVALGGFDERFEYLFDDADSAVRFGLAGHALVQLRQGVVYHAPAAGRNRSHKSRYDLNWYCWLRSTIYFALKNGRRALGLRSSFRQALRHTFHFYSVVSDLAERDQIDEDLRRKIRRQLQRGWREGFWTGLFGRRRMPVDLTRVSRPFLPFRDASSTGGMSGDCHLAGTPLVGPRSRPVKTLDLPPLRLALLSVGYPPASTEGVARSSEILAKGLAELGHEVHVITLGESRRTLLRDGVYLHEIRSAPRRRYALLGAEYSTTAAWLDWSHAAYDEIRDLLVNHRIQVVDTPLWNLDGLVTAVSGELPVVVRVVTAMRQIKEFAHGEVPAEYRLLGDLEAELLNRAAAVVSNTEATARTLERIYDFDTSDARHEIVLYGVEPVDETRLAPDPGESETEEEVTVLFVGRLESRKGILDLFEAIPKVLVQHRHVRFVLAGSDNSDHDGFADTHGVGYPAYFAHKHPELASRVEFQGYVPDDELHRLYRDSDLLVAPSLYESFGLIYLEAMNYARPAIGCSAGGPPEIITDGETGRLVPPGDSEALAQAICEIVALGPARRSLGRVGREHLLERFTHVTMAEGFEGVYRRALERVGKHPAESVQERTT
ncbi:MAG: glycosyltransferase [Thermoanaerobaculia bacterium]|nr:glycosyltransferase [Thermoanaerobaculia bacterium]